jgi:autotransporter translocation and assembly factor TamB
MKKQIITLLVAASAVIHAQVAEPKKQAAGGDKAPAAGQLEDISAQPIPDKPATGKVHGKEFKIEKATLEEGILKLRQGEGFDTHLEEFEIDLSRKNVENFAGQTFSAKLSEKASIDITLAYTGEKKGSIKSQTFMREYTMKLEFGTAKDGKLPGKIHLRLPDEAGSFVIGTFEAEIK